MGPEKLVVCKDTRVHVRETLQGSYVTQGIWSRKEMCVEILGPLKSVAKLYIDFRRARIAPWSITCLML